MQTSTKPITSQPGWGERLGDFFSLKQNLVILLIAIFVIGSGEELWMRFVPKYLQTLGASALIIGVYDGIRTLLGAVYAYPGGLVVDRWGHRRAFLAFNVLSILGYALVLFIPRWGAVIVGMFLFLSWTCFSLPATLSLVGATLATDRHSMGVGVQMVIRRLPIMIAPIVGGMLIDHFGVVPGVRIALVLSILLSGATIFVQKRFHDEPTDTTTPPATAQSIQGGGPGAPSEPRLNFFQTLREFNPGLRRLLWSDILVRFCERLPFAWVVIFAMDYLGMTGEQVGLLIAVEMLAATLCIIPTSYFADKTQREPFVIATFVMFTLFPIWMLMSRSFIMLFLAFLIRGLKEFGDTSRKALIIGYSNPERCGQTVGAYYLVRDLIVSVGAILGAVLWKIGPRVNFLGAALFGIVGTIIYVRGIRHARAAAAPVMLFYDRKPPPK